MKRFCFPVLPAPAHLSGLAALLTAGILYLLKVPWSHLPLILFVFSCLAAPFFPRWGYFLPVISRGSTSLRELALTFDDGPDPEMTPAVLALLRRRRVRATFFVTGTQVMKHPELVRRILAEGHSLGNHSFSHDVLLMFRSTRQLSEEIDRLQDLLSPLGSLPRVFRPPVGITNPRLGPVLAEREMACVNFDCRALDGGNRWINGLSDKILKKIRPGSIILLHDVRHSEKTDKDRWISEVERLLDGIATQGYTIVPLEELIGRPVMIPVFTGIKNFCLTRKTVL